ncbi:hypothetical protein FLONG3_3583 [Fusarium longipes]|uniref:Uncharacterized protein n=1 Tax=Fusarium longipes TaxID=694270 RepID=A0A395T0N4_9HYPO|nr:hypothetical protein FLONG3_3583 [Fusarium longipes]
MKGHNITTTDETSDMTNRVAYIRTILDRRSFGEHDQTERINLQVWLENWVGQKVPWDPCGRGPHGRTSHQPGLRQHYILGHSTAADSFILDWLLNSSISDNARLRRTDFEVFFATTQVNDPSNKNLLQRLASENVKVKKITAPSEEYKSQDICDSVMMFESDYIIDPALQHGPDSWISIDALYRDSLRYGHPQRYRTERLNNYYYQNRRKNKMGHAKRWWTHKCPSCGHSCKRSKGCKKTGEDWAAEMNKYKTAWMEGVDLSAARPPDFESNWRSLSANDVVYYYGADNIAHERFRNWSWRSVDTFSGDWKGE